MEWLLAGAAIVAWLVYRGSRNSRKQRREFQIQNHLAGQRREGSRAEFGTKLPWVDPRANPDPKFFEGSNQWDRQQPRSQSDETGAQAANRTPARWVAPGETARVGSIPISSGMFYLGGMFVASTSGHTDNCLINPALKVALSGSDLAGHTMPYWPSYSDIQPIARRTYLQWLAGARTDPSIGIGYVFLFFYGLERRLFVDGAKDEARAIIQEVKRLLAIYGENNSFRGYAAKLIDAAEVLKGPDIYRPALSPDLRNGYEMPLPVRLHLGRKLNAKERFDDKDALLWVLSLPDTYLRTAASRCFAEFVELWSIRFSERYPDGLAVKAPKTRIKLEYRAASGTFEAKLDLADSAGPLPDIAAISAPVDGLRDLLGACTDELGAYSRLLGKSPDAKGTIEAAFLLPREMLTSSSALGTAVIRRIEDLFDDRTIAPTSVDKLLSALGMGTPDSGKLSAGLCNQIGAFLDKMDIGFEPDKRYGSKNLTSEGYVLLFKAKDGAPVDGDKEAYVSARTMTDITALAAAADGSIAPSEYEGIKADLRAFPGLTSVERARLMAYSATLLKDIPGQQVAMYRLRKLPEAERGKVIQSAISAVLADGHAGPEEVKFLEKLYKTMGHPAEDVYSALHRGAVVVDEPIVVAAEKRQPGIPIPAQQPPAEKGLTFDAAKLERIKSETSAVSALLAGIFIEDDPVPASSTTQAATPDMAGTVSFGGLDRPHGELLTAILSSGKMGRSELEDHARSLRLLPEGAIETINEWGFDTFDEPILEGDDPVAIVDHIRAELLKLEPAE